MSQNSSRDSGGNESLTVVLPVHNAETTLCGSVDRILEIAGDLTSQVEVLIVDDGSTDDTFDVANELASRFPQVSIIHQATRRGLAPTLQSVRRRVKSDVMMVHDGVSEMNPEQLRALWTHRIDPGQPTDVTIADLLRPRANHRAMAAAHGRLMSFQLVSPDSQTENEKDASSSVELSANTTLDQAHGQPKPSSDVGAIPSLPRPNIMGTLGEFALGE